MPVSNLFAVVLASLTIAAVIQAEPATTQPAAPLLGTRWTIVEVEGQPALPAERGAAYLEFSAEQTRYSSSGGINRIGGAYTLDGKSLKLGDAFSTMMAGPEPLMQQERKSLQALGKVDAFEIVGDKLHLLAGDEVVLRLQAK